MTRKTTFRPQLLIAIALSLLLAGFVLSACNEEPAPSPTATAIPAPTTPAVQPTTPPAPIVAPPPPATAVPAPTAAPAPTATTVPPKPTATTPPAPTATATAAPVVEPIAFDASTVAITVDGDTSDWADISPTTVLLQSIMPIEGVEFGEIDPIEADLRIAIDSERIYVLMEVPDDYDYNPDDHHFSPAIGVMFGIDPPAAPHMGTTEEDQDNSLGKVDIWHWELDCAPGPGLMSGGNDAASGNDPDCNMDDEWSTTPEEREDDGSANAENSLAGIWDHTARASGNNADGTWIFEMSRLLQTGDPDDAQFTPGGTTNLALAYWDADETDEGWTDAGHIQSSSGGWVVVTLPDSPVAAVREPVTFDAATADIVVDGDISDWTGIIPTSVRMQQIKPYPGSDFGPIDPIDADLRIASDGENIYVLMEVPDDLDYNPDDHHFSPAIGVMFRIDEPASPHMGSTEEDPDTSLGKVDIWHWELDCAPLALSGGNDVASGNDPDCNMDDEYSTTPEEREDDDSPTAENTLKGVWEHTGRAGGNGADGTWIFEMSRPLTNADPDDAQFTPGEDAAIALAYWDADETDTGWTDAGHLQSSSDGWVTVTMPTTVMAATASITVDGDTADWDAVQGSTVTMQQILPYPGSDFGPLDDIDATLKVATDGEQIFVLMEVPDDYDYNPDDHHFSPAIGVMLRIDEPAAPHMGTTEEDQDTSLGKVDIWHWELDCAPGAGILSGGNDDASGNDPDCNMDDEWSTTPENREDDGSATAENTLVGVWDHTARAEGNDADGTWIFEMSRPLTNADPDDAQVMPGGTVNFALAYWDADETDTGWTDAGHVQSSTGGWVEVRMPLTLKAASATQTVDGITTDWDAITGATVKMQQILPYPGSDFGPVGDIYATLKVATDADNVYVLMEVPDDYDYNPDDHHFSPAIGVMLRIDEPAAPHMGTTEEDQDTSLGKVDIWHWELDCPPGTGTLSGGNDDASGNDPDCNMDDEWSTTPENREDDGSATAENTLVGVWDHTARADGNNADGVWIFEMSRPLTNADPDDAQLTAGGSAQIALAYWDADETDTGWTDAGHVQSSTSGWIEVILP